MAAAITAADPTAAAVCALIPAAGRGVRFGATGNKVFTSLLDRPLLGWTLEAFARCDEIARIVLVGAPEELDRLRELGEQYGGGKLLAVVPGGSDRQASVRNGLAACADFELVAVHDAARPCIRPELIASAVRAARNFQAVTLAVPVTDTLARGHELELNGPDVDRSNLYAIQTPQVFDRALLVAAHDAASRKGIQGTDDAGLVRSIRGSVHFVPGSPQNLKVTRPEDLAHAEAILRWALGVGRQAIGVGQEAEVSLKARVQAVSEAGRNNADLPEPGTQRPMPNAQRPSIRVGHGYDVHAFAEGRKLFLGGVEFEGEPWGLLGHSDADVVLHALCDALLGAAGLPDIGKLFLPSDMRHKDRRSTEFLDEVRARLDAARWSIANVDLTILAEKPKIGPKAETIRRVIAVHLGIQHDQIGIKATTNEGMGFVGRGEGIAAYATVLLTRSE